MSYFSVKFDTSCQHKSHYQGKDHSIFFWSRAVAAGDKIGWDFINRTLTSRLAFSAYCLDITQVYQSSHPNSMGFMSKTTFVSWFFSWCGSMNIEFRQKIDPWCKYNLQCLARGLSHSRVTIDPIDKAYTAEVVKPKHKRFDRVFLPYRDDLNKLVRQARVHLKATCHRYLSTDTSERCEGHNREAGNDNLLKNCPQDP